MGAIYRGISRYLGLANIYVENVNGVAKGNIWSVSGEQKEASLFRELTNADWASYTQGVNSATFVAVGSSSSNASVYFEVNGHTAGDIYDFKFDKTGTQATRIFSIRISTNSALTTDLRANDIGADSGATARSITYNETNSTIYIGFYKDNSGSTATLDITNFTCVRR